MSEGVTIYTDGACRGNPGPGGWGVWLMSGAHSKKLKGAEKETTNNRMELTAAIEGLRALKRGCEVTVVTDSKYVKDGVLSWLENWKRNGWRNSQKKPVKNKDLWMALDEEIVRHEVTWEWVKGHSGHEGNEMADLLANEAIDTLLSESF